MKKRKIKLEGGEKMVKSYKSLVVVAMCLLGLLFLTVKPASAYVIDVWYTWYSTGGTKAEGDESWTVGDVTGTKLIKIEEYWASSTGQFRYDIHSITDPVTYIYDIKIYNPNHILATSTVPPTVGVTTWSEDHASDYWYWYTKTAPVDGATAYFSIYSSAPRGLVTAEASRADGSIIASGLVSGPVPEPASLLLLGSGLLGLAAFGGLRRRKA